MLNKTCLECDKIIEINTKYDVYKKFCNSSCAAKYNNKRRTHTEQTKLKISHSINNRILKNTEYKNYTCNNCSELIQSHKVRKLCDKCKELKKQLKYIKYFKTPKTKCIRCGKECVNKFCSQLCSAEYMKHQTMEKIRLGIYNSTNLSQFKRYLIETRGHACELCKNTEWMGVKIPLVIDHINGRSSDNRLENLRLVCGNCDMLLPTYKSKNKNSDRKYRTKH